MKHANIIWASLFLFILPACERALEEDTSSELSENFKVLTVNASRSEATKTSYADDKTFAWCIDDQISILCNDGSANSWETFTSGAAAASTPLTATVPAGTYLGSVSGKKPAMYPASTSHVYTDDTHISYHIPAVRDFRSAEGGHTETAIPMFAWGDDADSYAFANMTGAVKFTFVGLGATQVKFTFTAATEKMNGDFALTGLDEDDASLVTYSVSSAASDAEKTLTFYADVKDGGVHFYVPYPAGTLSAGAAVRLEDVSGGAVLYENTSLGAINVTKNRIAVLPPLVLGDIALGFTQSEEDIMNPERGFCSFGEYSFDESGNVTSGYINSALLADNSLVHLMFFLTGFKSADHINDTALNNIREVLGQVRDAGKKAIVRFAYTSSIELVNNPNKTRVLNHIGDLTPIFTEYEDVIYVVQAGFLGAWGEWWPGYTSHFPDYTFNGNVVTDDGGRGEVLTALLEAVPTSRQVALRTPYYKYYAVNGKKYDWIPISGWDGTDPNSRLSFHNDAFRGSFKEGNVDPDTGTWATHDIGTFESAHDRKVWHRQAPYLATGGELATFTDSQLSTFEKMFEYTKNGVTLSYASAENTLFAIYWEGLSYLKAGPAADRYIARWRTDSGDDAYIAIRKALGYRLWLSAASIKLNGTSAGSTMEVELTLKNTGAVSVINKRPMKLMLVDAEGNSEELAELGDVRLVVSNGEKVYTANITLPVAVRGGSKLALWLPDYATGLQDNPAYAIRLANNETSFEGVGYNVFYTFE